MPETGIILGTGLGGVAKEIDVEAEINYNDIPHFVTSTVEHHAGKLIFSRLSGKNIVAMQGRYHFYEGYTMNQITFPVRVMKYIGVNSLIITSACGSMNPYFRKTEIMLIEDHINLLGGNPLIGKNDNSIGPRYPDMSQPYSHRLIDLSEQIALENNIKLHKGVYAAVAGPNLETRAEYRFLRTIGADVVGMSTVPENLAAKHLNMEVAAFSIITDECYPEALKPAKIEEIIEAAEIVEPHLNVLIRELVARI